MKILRISQRSGFHIIHITLAIVVLLLFSCQNKSEEQTYTSGRVKILVDESIAPIIDDEAYVFESIYQKVKLDLINKPENELLPLFLNDSIRMAILSRPLTKKESRFYDSRKIKIRTNCFAMDGIALITHRSNPDSTLLITDILNAMHGQEGKIKNLVFDHAGSSTVRYLKELAGVKKLPSKGMYALQSNAEVIQYICEHPRSIGVVGVNWMLQPDKNMEPLLAQLRIIGVKNKVGKVGDGAYYKPNQNDIALGLYPLTRALYVINCEGRPGVGAGFASFLAGEHGQRIVLKSGLLPYQIPPREILIRK